VPHTQKDPAVQWCLGSSSIHAMNNPVVLPRVHGCRPFLLHVLTFQVLIPHQCELDTTPFDINEAKAGGDKDLGGRLPDLVPSAMEEVRVGTMQTHAAYR